MICRFPSVISTLWTERQYTAVFSQKERAIAVEGIELNRNSLTMTKGESTTFIAAISPFNATNREVTWTSSNPNVAVVDSNGKVTAKAAGTATITVTAKDGGKTATCKVTVTEPVISVSSVSLNKTTTNLEKGNSVTLTAAVSPSNATNKAVAWTSSNTNIAAVDANGKVTAKAAGTATITVETVDGKKTATCKVTVTEPKPSPDPKPAPSVETVDMYRMYNPNSGEHFYTGNVAEWDHLISLGWNYEGVGFKAPKKSNTPMYRLYNPNAGDHHYTHNVGERNYLISIGWNDEGIGWYADDNKEIPQYRLYNPNATGAGSHHYTWNPAERNHLISLGWKDEGIGFYSCK